MTQQRYLVTARKYRPQVFGELVGQEHVSETLKNAIRLNRLAHAYLFSGPRGVGKTTAARILAKAINCTTPPEKRKDESEPCLECDSCKTFSEGRSLNVIEIDAASNNGVDDIRELRETVRIPPQGARKKVYIVDEVHMLSKPAFNALLKTLEEPPPYVLFIFATTEPHKVIPTVLSRCQRFDFRRIAIPEIILRLGEICKTEEITADERSLMLLARKGDGALRDAMSAFDQAVALCGSNIEYQALADAFRVVNEDLFFEVTDYADRSDSAGMLSIVQRLVDEGYDLQEFLGGLLGHLRSLLIALTTRDVRLIEATADIQEKYQGASANFSEADLLRMMMVISDTEQALRSVNQPRLNVELGLLRLSQMSRVEDLQNLVAQLRGETETTASGKPANNVSSGPDDKPAPKRSRVSPTESTEAPTESTQRSESPTDAVVVAELETPAPDSPATTDLFGPPALKRRSARDDHASSSVGIVEGSAARAAVAEPTGDKPQALREIENHWLGFVRAVKSARIHVGSLLQHASPVAAEGAVLAVGVPDDFHKRLLTNQESFLVDLLGAQLPGKFNRISFAIRDGLNSLPDEHEKDTFDAQAYMERKREENPMVRALFDEFGGELVW